MGTRRGAAAGAALLMVSKSKRGRIARGLALWPIVAQEVLSGVGSGCWKERAR